MGVGVAPLERFDRSRIAVVSYRNMFDNSGYASRPLTRLVLLANARSSLKVRWGNAREYSHSRAVYGTATVRHLSSGLVE